MQPDSIISNPANPQSFNRYGYVLNNPIRHNDPTGHVCSDPENTSANAGCESGSNFVTKKDIKIHSLGYRVKKSGRSEFERTVLLELLNAGDEGIHAAEYLVNNNVTFDNLTNQPFGTGAGWNPDGTISFPSNDDGSLPDPTDPWVVSLIAHEAMHLEQGPLLALTAYGELQA